MEEALSENTEKKKFKQTHADWTLGLISFTESAFMPILTDPFLLAMTIAKPHLWVRYTIIAGVTSVLGGLFGYFLGAVLFDLVGADIIAFYNAESLYERTVISMSEGAFWFTLIGAFTPIPYKLVAIVGGVLHINLLTFVVASAIGRFVRFFIVTYISYKFGAYALKQFNRRFTLVTIAIVAGLGAYFVMLLV